MGVLQSEGAIIVLLLQNPQDKNSPIGNRRNKKAGLARKQSHKKLHDSVYYLYLRLTTIMGFLNPSTPSQISRLHSRMTSSKGVFFPSATHC